MTYVTVCSSPAQQEAQRAQFYVEKAKQDQKQKIIQAEGEAQAAKMVNFYSLLVELVQFHLHTLSPVLYNLAVKILLQILSTILFEGMK